MTNYFKLLPVILITIIPLSCVTETHPPVTNNARLVSILHINDVYRIGGVDSNTRGGMARLRTLRQQLEKDYSNLLLTHAGDFLFPSMLSREFNGQHMVDLMNQLDGDSQAMDKNLFVTFGNHEFDKATFKDVRIVQDRLNESDFYWLSDNITWKTDTYGKAIASDQLVNAYIKEINGVKVGLFGLTTNMKVPEYADIDGNYIDKARQVSQQLRAQGAELLIAITHLRMSEDKAILSTLKGAGPDVILGGHEHNQQSFCVDNQNKVHCVIKADADLRTAAFVSINPDSKTGVTVSYEYKNVDQTITEDQKLKESVAQWEKEFSQKFCRKMGAAEGCLTTVLGKTDVTLVAEELEIRRYETNLGDFIVDQALKAFKEKNAQVAFINSGSLRLNQNIPAGSDIRERDLREIFQYQTVLKLVEISGDQLQKIINHSIEDWTGNGRWLQIAGFKYVHDTKNKKATGLMILDNGVYRAVVADEKIIAVTGDYLMNPNTDRDGYTMFSVDQEIPVENPPNLLALTREAIQAEGVIAPKLDKRICSTDRDDC